MFQALGFGTDSRDTFQKPKNDLVTSWLLRPWSAAKGKALSFPLQPAQVPAAFRPTPVFRKHSHIPPLYTWPLLKLHNSLANWRVIHEGHENKEETSNLVWNRKILFWQGLKWGYCRLLGFNSLISVLAASGMTLEKDLCQLDQNLQIIHVRWAKHLNISITCLFNII